MPPAQKPCVRPGRIVFWVLFGLAAACFIAGFAGFAATAKVYKMPSTSMMNTLKPGDQFLMERGHNVHRGASSSSTCRRVRWA
ncbi:MAG TPA: hypothetical protein VGG75_29880 [Trebonia sp.]